MKNSRQRRRGEEHQVTVMADGFEYPRVRCTLKCFVRNAHGAQRYRSLSIIARTITGSVWSGPKFFGLK
ncbi:MAG: DUF2924 domain-containing protein [Holosporales bacterium]